MSRVSFPNVSTTEIPAELVAAAAGELEVEEIGHNYWVRVKPLNPKRGLNVQRIVVLGRLWKGGDGVTDIPEWVRVNAAQAAFLQRFRQSDRDPYSPRVFDIVGEDQRRTIDSQEEHFRKAMLGIGSAPITELPNVSAPEGDVTRAGQQRKKRITMADLENKGPEISPEERAALKDALIDRPATIPGAKAPEIVADEVDTTGRLAALDDLPEAETTTAPPAPTKKAGKGGKASKAAPTATAKSVPMAKAHAPLPQAPRISESARKEAAIAEAMASDEEDPSELNDLESSISSQLTD